MRLHRFNFSGRSTALCFIAGIVYAHQQAFLPSVALVGWGLVVLAMVLALMLWRAPPQWLAYALPIVAFMIAVAYVTLLAQQRLAQRLPVADENRVSTLTFQILSMPQEQPHSRRFLARVLGSQPKGVPGTVLVSWHNPKHAGPYRQPEAYDFPRLMPGQVWRVNAVVKTPHGMLNPAGFDYERHMFAQGVRAQAAVRGQPRLITEQGPFSWRVLLEQQRTRLRAAMLPHTKTLRYGGVLLALTVGDQAAINAEDWRTFNRGGLTHLVSISGTHISLVAGMVALLVAWCWRSVPIRGRVLAMYVPAQYIAAFIALTTAVLYCLIAGWGVPAQRALLMLSIAVLAQLSRIPLGVSRIFLLAAVVVLLVDPWAVLGAGFWLSFGAVAILILCAQWQGVGYERLVSRRQSWQRRLLDAANWQLLISVALLPALAWSFGEVSIVSPLTNAYAIPLISLLVTPMALLFMLSSQFVALQGLAKVLVDGSHMVIEYIMWLTQWFIQLPFATCSAARAPWWVYAVALAAIVIAMVPHASYSRYAAWIGVLPCLLWPNKTLKEGEWQLDALDIGQGNAVVVRTKNSVLLYDAGLRYSPDSDAAQQIILPYLRHQGIRQLHTLVLSHADLDHIGGSFSVLDNLAVWQVYSSFNVAEQLQKEARYLQRQSPLKSATLQSYCQAGTEWVVDGVRFRFLWPREGEHSPQRAKNKNAHSCVLAIEGAYHNALLTGDIEQAQEQALVASGIGPYDFAQVPHHGSTTSSSAAFVRAVRAQLVVAQMGWWNRYAHPAAHVEQRWQQVGSAFFRSDFHGAVRVRSTAAQRTLAVSAQRVQYKRYWHHHLSATHLP